MARRVAINGFGRIGRLSFRALWVRRPDEVRVVAINDPAGAAKDGLLVEYDSNYGRFPGQIRELGTHLEVDGQPIALFAERDWTQLDWAAAGVHTVIECSGKGTARDQAEIHLARGAKLVVVSAPASDDDATLVMGVNEDEYRPGEHRIISAASCTTNCLAPVAQVLQEAFGLKWGMLSTVHSYTNSQQLHDRGRPDPREGRAGALNIIPGDTGAARALGKVLPALQGRFDGMAFRVPTPTVSVIDFVCETERTVSQEDVIAAFRAAEAGRLRGILGVNDRPLVSTDFKGDERSAIVDAPSTIVLDGRIVKVVAWYDNEWGYSCRVADLVAYTARRDRTARLLEPSLAA